MERDSTVLYCQGQRGQYGAVQPGKDYRYRNAEDHTSAGQSDCCAGRYDSAFREGGGRGSYLPVVFQEGGTDRVEQMEGTHARHGNRHAQRDMEWDSAVLRDKGRRGRFREVGYSDDYFQISCCRKIHFQKKPPRRVRFANEWKRPPGLAVSTV